MRPYALLCCAVLCYAMLCYAMLCYAMLGKLRFLTPGSFMDHNAHLVSEDGFLEVRIAAKHSIAQHSIV